MTEKKATSNVITTAPARLSFPNLFTPVPPGRLNAGYYTCSLYFPKAQKEALKPLSNLIRQMAVQTWGDKVPTGIQLPLKDGDKISDENAAGYVVLRCKTKFQPQCYRKIGGGFTPVIDPDVFYPGCWVVAEVSPYVYKAGQKNGNNNGVGFGITKVLFVRDDESFISRTKPDEAFAGVEIDESAVIGADTVDPEAATDIPGLNF